MPASFAPDLCGYRRSDQGPNPNTADNNDELSKELGLAMFDAMGVPRQRAAEGNAGIAMELAVADDLAHWREDLEVDRARSAAEFEQYAHLNAFPDFKRAHRPAAPLVHGLALTAATLANSPQAAALRVELDIVTRALEQQDELAERLKADMPEESLLRINVTCARPQPQGGPSLLAVGLSSKWSLRTDRAQDCISQGAKLADARRGRMPHFAVVTMEPRPAMLRLLTDGSGAIDCVYHLHLPALVEAIDRARATRGAGWAPGNTFDRLIAQRRLRDYDELIDEVVAVPVVL